MTFPRKTDNLFTFQYSIQIVTSLVGKVKILHEKWIIWATMSYDRSIVYKWKTLSFVMHLCVD